MNFAQIAVGLVGMALLAACSSTPEMQEKPSSEFVGLNKVTGTGFNEAWARPNAGLTEYKVIAAGPMTSAGAEVVQPGGTTGSRLNRDWELTQERQDALAASWNKSITQAAEKAGLDSSGNGDKVLRIDAALTRIAPSANFAEAQSAPGRTTVYTEDSGEASVEFRLYDQASGELLAVIRDKRRLGAQVWGRSGTVTAGADARNTLNSWATQLVRRVTGN